MVSIALEAGVDDTFMHGDEAVFIATVEIHAACVEEETKLEEVYVQVDWY